MRGDKYDAPAWLEFFLTPAEKDRFAAWHEVIIDRSVVNTLADPIFQYLSGFVPDSVAPNVLTLAGSFSVLQAWYFCEVYAESMPLVSHFVSVVSLILFWVLGGIDGKHARRTMNDTSLGELFKYVSDINASIFLVVVMCTLLLNNTRDYETMWYCVQTSQLILLVKHYSAFLRDAGLRYFLIGPGELVTWAAGALLFGAIFGLEPFRVIYSMTWGFCCDFIASTFGLPRDGYVAKMYPARAAYLTVFVVCVLRIGISPKSCRLGEHSWTRRATTGILLMRSVSAFIRLVLITEEVGSAATARDVIFDGLFLGMITSDIIVSKMAGRELHVTVVLMASMVLMPHLQLLILCFVIFYYVAVFADLMHHMNLPLLQKCTNVYCDGVYDLCHIGHKNAFRKALAFGNRLFVGVVGDEDASNYKRPPIMSAAEREAEVRSCKGVTKAISNSPCFGLTVDFIKKHRIHVVCFGQEYLDRFPNPDDDPYYKVPRKMGIAKPLPRTPTLSTSDLIRRIQSRDDLDSKKSPT